ncbi:MAG: deoxyribose-phosphate aldolase [Ilumatobacteraceae bacterium]
MPHAGPARRALALVDLTELGESPSPDDIDRLCDRAVGPHGSTAAVCVWPRFATQAVQRLAGTGVAVATVVNFPSGGDDVEATVAETRRALDDGVDEIDLVLPYRSFLAGRIDVAAAMVDAVRAVVTSPRRLKVILETGSYPSVEAITAAATLAVEHGADFIKTSTGKTAVSATPEAARAMLEVIRDSGRPVGIKPSGGIRTLADASSYLAIADEIMGPQWASPATFRFGASGLLDALEAAISGTEPGDASALRY